MPRIPAHVKNAQQLAFLASYKENGNVRLACEAAEIGRRTHYDWVTEDEVYAKAFAEAKEEAADALEEEARRRAVDGVEEPTGWYQGEPGGYVRRYSDTLLIFLLKGTRPQKYRERPDATVYDFNPDDFSDAGLDRVAGGEDPVHVLATGGRANRQA